MYNILEAYIEYKNRQLSKVAVLVEISRGDIRAIFCTTGVKQGYDHIEPDEPVNDALLQRVAGYGMQISIDKVSKTFPGWKKHIAISKASKAK
jgi:hypothetical protein